jgi:DNA polymerase I-like protein with 3'-5' exonuclease and polymerase domains
VSTFKYLARKFIIPATTKSAGPRGAFDIETDSLDATVVHCLVIVDLDTNEIRQYGPDQILDGLDHLSRFAYLVGHNITGFDLPTLQRLCNWSPPASCTIVDTMVAARLILPNIDDLDDKVAAMHKVKAGKLRGKYTVEAFGKRLGIAKVGTDIEDFSKWTPEMQERCVVDTLIAKAIWLFLQPDGYPAEALALEHRIARICARITADGCPFNVKAAEERQRQWTERRAKIGAQLAEQFPGTNLNSHKQLGALLEARGWIPEERTEKTKQPKITDEVLESIPAMFPEFAGLAEHDILRRRLAQLSDGDEAWCRHVDADGRIHGGLVHIGTPHSRAKHLSPNLAQVPNPKRGKPFATECRSLFRAPDGWVFVCCDQAGLQDRAFAHYLAEFDAGAYTKAFLNGLDPHWKTSTDLDLITKGTELDKQNRVHVAIREHSKGFRYGFLFGAGQARAGHIINNTIRTVCATDANIGNELHKRFFGNTERPNEDALKRIGKTARDKFITNTPGLQRLTAKLKGHVSRYGWLPGLDGRRVPADAQYKALNFQVSSAEAVITKRWLARVFDELNQKFRYGWDGDVVIALWVHDEIACCCRPEIADQVGEIMVRHAKEPGEFYGFKVPLDADYKIGRSWAGDDEIEPELGDRRPSLAPVSEVGARPAAPAGVIHTNAEIGRPDNTLHARPVPVNTAAGLRPHAGAVDAHRISSGAKAASANGKIICPFHDDHDPSLQLYTDGHYHCYVCGAHGNIEELPEALPAPAPNASRSEANTLDLGIRLWQVAVSIRGTLAERYLIETRKLNLAVLPNIDAVLRFHPRCPFDGNKYPCVIALFRDVETDEVAGIHRIALTADAEKIGRMMLGSWSRPRAIKLRPGADKKLIVGEGIETTIAGGMRARKTIALWAMGSANAIRQLPPVTDVTQLMILVDRDKNNVGMDNARTCAKRWQYAKRKCVLLCPQQDDTDFNDLIGRKSP